MHNKILCEIIGIIRDIASKWWRKKYKRWSCLASRVSPESDPLGGQVRALKGAAALDKGKGMLNMKMGHLLAIAAFVVVVFNVVQVAPGSATEMLWLKNGTTMVTPQQLESNGEFTIGNLKTILGEIAVLCTYFSDDEVGPGAEGKVNEFLNSSKESVELGGHELVCTNVKNCPTPRAAPLNVPWNETLELMGTPGEPLFLNIYSAITGEPGWEIDCTEPLVGLVEESCFGPFSSNIENDPGEEDVLGSMSVSELEKEGLLLYCSSDREYTGFITTNEDGPLLVELAAGGTLAVSYE
jgi:hypothetical protein